LGSEQYYIGGLEIYTKDEEKKNLLKNQLKLDFGPEYKITTIEEQHQEIFSWLNLIYQNVYIILGLMIAVAVINMSCALLVLIVEKTKMIGILKALGVKNVSLIKIFVSHGGILLLYGFLAGNSLAIIIIQLQNKFEFLKLSQENYYLDAVPMEYPLSTIIILNFSAFIFCLITMILPSVISSKTSPVKAISSEI
jgi:lipoprotein-releasing system permease protein